MAIAVDESGAEAAAPREDAAARCQAAPARATPEGNDTVLMRHRAGARSPRSPRSLKRRPTGHADGPAARRRMKSPPLGRPFRGEWPASPLTRLEEQAVRYVQDWGEQMIAGNEVLLHGAEQLALHQVSLALHVAQSGRVRRQGDGALEDALLAATKGGHLGMVARHIRDEECRECLREVLADIADDVSAGDLSDEQDICLEP